MISLAYDSWNPDLYPWYMPCVFTPPNRYYIENALDELDQPGEWCLHGDDGMLHSWPPEGAGTNPEVVLPRRRPRKRSRWRGPIASVKRIQEERRPFARRHSVGQWPVFALKSFEKW